MCFRMGVGSASAKAHATTAGLTHAARWESPAGAAFGEALAQVRVVEREVAGRRARVLRQRHGARRAQRAQRRVARGVGGHLVSWL